MRSVVIGLTRYFGSHLEIKKASISLSNTLMVNQRSKTGEKQSEESFYAKIDSFLLVFGIF